MKRVPSDPNAIASNIVSSTSDYESPPQDTRRSSQPSGMEAPSPVERIPNPYFESPTKRRSISGSFMSFTNERTMFPNSLSASASASASIGRALLNTQTELTQGRKSSSTFFIASANKEQVASNRHKEFQYMQKQTPSLFGAVPKTTRRPSTSYVPSSSIGRAASSHSGATSQTGRLVLTPNTLYQNTPRSGSNPYFASSTADSFKIVDEPTYELVAPSVTLPSTTGSSSNLYATCAYLQPSISKSYPQSRKLGRLLLESDIKTPKTVLLDTNPGASGAGERNLMPQSITRLPETQKEQPEPHISLDEISVQDFDFDFLASSPSTYARFQESDYSQYLPISNLEDESSSASLSAIRLNPADLIETPIVNTLNTNRSIRPSASLSSQTSDAVVNLGLRSRSKLESAFSNPDELLGNVPTFLAEYEDKNPDLSFLTSNLGQSRSSPSTLRQNTRVSSSSHQYSLASTIPSLANSDMKMMPPPSCSGRSQSHNTSSEESESSQPSSSSSPEQSPRQLATPPRVTVVRLARERSGDVQTAASSSLPTKVFYPEGRRVVGNCKNLRGMKLDPSDEHYNRKCLAFTILSYECLKKEEDCDIEICQQFRDLIVHINTCKDDPCDYQNCTLVQELYQHWKKCDLGFECAELCRDLGMVRRPEWYESFPISWLSKRNTSDAPK